MKLLRTIRLDPSDTFVFDHAAEPGEWAVTGTFMYAEDDPAALRSTRTFALTASEKANHAAITDWERGSLNSLCS